jgi:hypothetical protein
MAEYIGGAVIATADITKSWGLNPASGNLTCPGAIQGLVGRDLTVNLGGATFYGVVSDARVETAFQSGKTTQVQIVDNRVKLQWEDIYCAFNMREIREDNPETPGIDRQKRYWHIHPKDWDSQTKTWTPSPLSAKDIIEAVLQDESSPLAYGWSCAYHSLQDKPVLGIDAINGMKFGTFLQEIAEQQDMVFSLTGQYGPFGLVWAKKGDGSLPAIPPECSRWSEGEAFSPHDTCIRVVGDRNRYQDTEIELEPDWNPQLEAFVYEPLWLAEVQRLFEFEDTMSGYAALAAKARSVTLREYCKAGGKQGDYGMWGEVCRMDVPVWVYLQDIIYKAYRVPRSYTINGIDIDSIELTDGLLCEVFHEPFKGKMAYAKPPVSGQYYPDAKAYVIVQGGQLNMLDPRTQTPITPEQLADARTLWSANNRFNIDTKNKVIVFEEPQFVPGEGDSALFMFPNRAVSGIDPTDPLWNLAVPNANAKLSAASVKASLVWDAERYSVRLGDGVRRGPKYFRGLNYNALMDGGVFSEEVPYADGKKADEKAAELGDAYLANAKTYASGSYSRPDAGTELGPCIDRVSVRMTFEEGLVETVSLTKEDLHDYAGEREMERRQRSRDLFPKQHKLLEEVKEWSAISKLLKGLKRNAPTDYASLPAVFQTPLGSIHSNPTLFATTDTWSAGQPVFIDPSTGNTSATGTAFKGIVVAQNSTGRSVAVATQGVVPVLVQGPVTAGDSIGIDPGADQTARKDGAVFIGLCNATYAGSDKILAPVRLGGGGASQALLAPFEVYAGSTEGTVRIAYNSKLFTVLRHPNGDPKQHIPKPLLAISGLSTPDPLPDGKPTPNYEDPGDFTPGLGPIWLTYYIDHEIVPGDHGNPPVFADPIAYIDYIKDKEDGTTGDSWEGWPDMVRVARTTVGGVPTYAQTAAYYLIGDVVVPDAPEPGKIFTIGQGKKARTLKIVQYAKSHLLLTDILYDALLVKAMMPLF